MLLNSCKSQSMVLPKNYPIKIQDILPQQLIKINDYRPYHIKTYTLESPKMAVAV